MNPFGLRAKPALVINQRGAQTGCKSLNLSFRMDPRNRELDIYVDILIDRVKNDLKNRLIEIRGKR